VLCAGCHYGSGPGTYPAAPRPAEAVGAHGPACECRLRQPSVVLCAGRVLAGLGAHYATTADQQNPSVLMALPVSVDCVNLLSCCVLVGC